MLQISPIKLQLVERIDHISPRAFNSRSISWMTHFNITWALILFSVAGIRWRMAKIKMQNHSESDGFWFKFDLKIVTNTQYVTQVSCYICHHICRVFLCWVLNDEEMIPKSVKEAKASQIMSQNSGLAVFKPGPLNCLSHQSPLTEIWAKISSRLSRLVN